MSCILIKQEPLEVEDIEDKCDAGPKQQSPLNVDETHSVKVEIEEFTSCENEVERSDESFTHSEVC